MRELMLAEIKAAELSLLKDFHVICEQLGLRYSLGGGTLLGAIRHKGFIPWDDDVDVMMPRPDYDKLICYCMNNKTPFTLFCHNNNPNYRDPFARIVNGDISITNENYYASPDLLRLGIDVFPVEGLGETYKEALHIYRKTEVIRELLVACANKKFKRSKSHAWYYEPLRLLIFVCSRFVNYKKLLEQFDSISRETEFDRSTFAGCVCGSYRKDEIMTQDTFISYIDVEFEKDIFKAIRNYNDYLTKHYGDYMKLPPIEKRVTHHTFSAYIEE